MFSLVMVLGLVGAPVLAEEPVREIAETRQDQDTIQRERERSMNLRPAPMIVPMIDRGAGFYSTRSHLTDNSTIKMPSPADGMSYDNDLRLAFACSESGVVGSIPAKFKNITWKIKGNAPTTNIQKGIVQTDQQGLAIIKINSNLKDLEGVSFVVGIGDEKLNVLAGNGPYTFEELPMSICKQPQDR